MSTTGAGMTEQLRALNEQILSEIAAGQHTDVFLQVLANWSGQVEALLAAAPQTGDGLRCMDCSALYEEFPLDTTLPDSQWRMIHPADGGVLCASCIVKRAGKLPGAIALRACLEFAPRGGDE